MRKLPLTFRPLTSKRWPDLLRLFGPRGASGGCWCMWWRLTRAQYEERKGSKNRAAFKKIVDSGHAPGVLAYQNLEPVGWCAVAPREVYPRMERSRVLARADSKPVWSVACLFVAKPCRRQGVTVQLLKAAVAHAASGGAKIVEGYPLEPEKNSVPDAFAWTGLASAFRKAGFREVLRRTGRRPIMRLKIARNRGARG